MLLVSKYRYKRIDMKRGYKNFNICTYQESPKIYKVNTDGVEETDCPTPVAESITSLV